jgi:excisionase family DNA binding protein
MRNKRNKKESKDFSLISQVPFVCSDGDDRLLTVPEAAQFLHIQPSSLYHLISQHRIPTIHISARCVRFSRRALHEWVESLTQAADHRHQ